MSEGEKIETLRKHRSRENGQTIVDLIQKRSEEIMTGIEDVETVLCFVRIELMLGWCSKPENF